ncbi:MAG: PilZ domain-containing protein [Planctomycetota bacterium]|nr:PilZ domain-containing protein [Planctomycetota bacterium]MDA1136951.1 PilZ domain-containing protein [Planctomycetota bacterium]
MGKTEHERRDFERVRGALTVHYRLESVSELGVADESLQGVTEDINPRGILLRGSLPSLDLVVPLLTQKVLLTIEIAIPRPRTVVKALAAVRWVEEVEEEGNQCAMGLYFNEIGANDRQKIFEFLVWQRTR